jgi:hypothetical protein
MPMSLNNLSPLFPYQKNSWKTFTDFYKHIEKEYLNKNIKLWFDGEGYFSFSKETIKEEFYLFSLNNVLYASSVLSINSYKIFIGIIEFTNDFITSDYFKKLTPGYYKKYKSFEASVNIELKIYNYEKEHKLLFSKADKVDLLFSQHLIYKDDTVVFEVKTSPSLKATIDWQKKVNKINEKMEKILAEKKLK